MDEVYMLVTHIRNVIHCTAEHYMTVRLLKCFTQFGFYKGEVDNLSVGLELDYFKTDVVCCASRVNELIVYS